MRKANPVKRLKVEINGPPVTDDEVMAAKYYVFTVCFAKEPDGGAILSAMNDWIERTPPERLPLLLQEAASNKLRDLVSYWGALWDAREAQERSKPA